MAGLEGTLKTPVGPVQKKTALVVGGGVVILGIIVWYRQKQLGGGDVVIPDAEINPATGYPYGSAEDAASLASQGAYVSAPATPGSGGSGAYPANLGYATNGQWVQAVVEYMVGNDLIAEPSQLSAALGKFVNGAYVTDAQVDLIQQAIAVQGFPPISGPNGYPPALNRNNPSPKPAEPTLPKAGSPRGYGWYRVKKGDTIVSVSNKYGLTSTQFTGWNGTDGLRTGEWVKVRLHSNPLIGYNGVK